MKDVRSKRQSSYSDFADSYVGAGRYVAPPEGYGTRNNARSDLPVNGRATTAERPRKHMRARKRKPDPNERVYALISAFIICFIIILISFIMIVSKDKSFSEDENRELAAAPKMNFSALTDGTYMDNTESYLSDQFPARSALVKTKTALDMFIGKSEENGVYIGKNRFLFQKPTKYDDKQVKKTVNAVNKLTKTHKSIKSYFLIAPNSSEVLSENMPYGAEPAKQEKSIKTIYSLLDKSISTTDVLSEFKNSKDKEKLYYRTDHHWTTEAAYTAFKKLAANMKLDTKAVKYNFYSVSDSFNGTMSSSAGLFNARDAVKICVPEKSKYVVTYTETKKKSATAFDASKLKQKNKYEVFFGGNFPEVHIETELTKNTLLVFKDSYANCLLPMLTPYYRNIIIIDPRYYAGDINKLIKQEEVDDILWLYNCDTFLSDTSISDMVSG